MKVTEEHNQKIAKMTVASVYAMKLEQLFEQKVNFEEFFKQANLPPNANQIKGLICGYRIEEIENPLTRKVRYLDKLVDELAKGKKLEKILRSDS